MRAVCPPSADSAETKARARECCQLILKHHRAQLGDKAFSQRHVADLMRYAMEPSEPTLAPGGDDDDHAIVASNHMFDRRGCATAADHHGAVKLLLEARVNPNMRQELPQVTFIADHHEGENKVTKRRTLCRLPIPSVHSSQRASQSLLS